MGWLDLIGLTLMADEELNAAKKASHQAKEAELAAMVGA